MAKAAVVDANQKLANEIYDTHMEIVGLTLFMVGPLGGLEGRQKLLMGASIPGLIKTGDGMSRLWRPKEQKHWQRMRGYLTDALKATDARFSDQGEKK